MYLYAFTVFSDTFEHNLTNRILTLFVKLLNKQIIANTQVFLLQVMYIYTINTFAYLVISQFILPYYGLSLIKYEIDKNANQNTTKFIITSGFHLLSIALYSANHYLAFPYRQLYKNAIAELYWFNL